MKKEIIILFILGTIISSVVGVIAANTISSSSVIYKDDRNINAVLDEIFENVDAIESDDARLTSLEGKVNALTSTHLSDITRIDNNITNINNKIGYTDISSIGDGTITGSISELNNNLNNFFQSVSDGKSLLATTLTNGGVSTASDATFDVINANISTYGTNMYNAGKSQGGGKLVAQSVTAYYEYNLPWSIKDSDYCSQPSTGTLKFLKAGRYAIFAVSGRTDLIVIRGSFGTSAMHNFSPLRTVSVGNYITIGNDSDGSVYPTIYVIYLGE